MSFRSGFSPKTCGMTLVRRRKIGLVETNQFLGQNMGCGGGRRLVDRPDPFLELRPEGGGDLALEVTHPVDETTLSGRSGETFLHCPDQSRCSFMATATTMPEANVRRPIAAMAQTAPNRSVMIPAESAPIAYPRSRQKR